MCYMIMKQTLRVYDMNWKALLESFFIMCFIYVVICLFIGLVVYVYITFGLLGYAVFLFSLLFIAGWIVTYCSIDR